MHIHYDQYLLGSVLVQETDLGAFNQRVAELIADGYQPLGREPKFEYAHRNDNRESVYRYSQQFEKTAPVMEAKLCNDRYVALRALLGKSKQGKRFLARHDAA